MKKRFFITGAFMAIIVTCFSNYHNLANKKVDNFGLSKLLTIAYANGECPEGTDRTEDSWNFNYSKNDGDSATFETVTDGNGCITETYTFYDICAFAVFDICQKEYVKIVTTY